MPLLNRIFGRDAGAAPKTGFTQATNNPNLYWTNAQNQGVPDLDIKFPSGDPQMSACAGPDENTYYVIAYEDPGGRPATYLSGTPSATYATSFIGFRGSPIAAGFAPLAQLVVDVTGSPLPGTPSQARTAVVNAGMYASW